MRSVTGSVEVGVIGLGLGLGLGLGTLAVCDCGQWRCVHPACMVLPQASAIFKVPPSY